MEEQYFWLGFSVFPGIGPKRFKLLLEHFETAKNSWEANSNELEPIIGKVFTAKFVEFRKTFDFQAYVNNLQVKKVHFLTITDKNYPSLLKQIDDPPFVLYIKGDKTLLCSMQNNKHIAIVGTRKITFYGREVTEQITKELVGAGFIIVSGLAFGVDACAHKTTIDMGGKTVAVLGCGVDCCSPTENTNLYNEIINSGGAIISEIPIGFPPTKGSFPSRNRIIAGLSEAVIVTEGASDSGALYTAKDALKLNRPVFAVPGPITSQLSKGPNLLIAKGAKLVTGFEDILEQLGTNSIGQRAKSVGKTAVKGDTKEEQDIINLLLNEQLHFDELVRKTKTHSSRLGTLLSIMEMKGILKSSGGVYGLMY